MKKNKAYVIKSLIEGQSIKLVYSGISYSGIFKEIDGDEEDGSIILKAIDSPIMLGFEIPKISDIEIIPVMNKKCDVIFRNQDGQELNLEITYSEEKGTLGFEITGNPENMKEHNGFHVTLSNILIQALSE